MKYGLRSSKKIRSHSIQEILVNENAEIRVDTRINVNVKIQCNKPDIFVWDKKRKEIILIEIGITSQSSLTNVESEKMRKYDLLANELGMMYKCKTRIIPYVMTWEGIVTIYHGKYASMNNTQLTSIHSIYEEKGISILVTRTSGRGRDSSEKSSRNIGEDV